MSSLARYTAAHLKWFAETYPAAYKDHGCPNPVKPQTNKANGLTTFIVNFLNWSGHRATRINVQGRLIESPVKQDSGVVLMTKKYMHSSTRKGTADISATIRGRSVMIEIKINDKPSEYQLAEQRRERAAGGIYEFIHSPEEFFTLYDSLVSS